MAKRLKPDDARDVISLRKVLTFTGEKTLRDLAQKVIQYRRVGKEKAATPAGELIKTAVNDKRLHRAAFMGCVTLLEMDEGKRAVYLASFDHYREKLGLDKIRQGSLNFDEGNEEKKPAKAKEPEPKIAYDAEHDEPPAMHPAMTEDEEIRSLADIEKQPSTH
jgi:hypothetical protein